MTRVGFIGLGSMGEPMAARLLEAGCRLTVHNRTPGRAEDLVARGAVWADTPAGVGEQADVVIAMLADEDASRSVWTGDEGVFSVPPAPGALAIECSTLSRAWVLELAALAAPRGWRYLDAPVTGLPENAAAGELTFLVGGARADLAEVEPLLDLMGAATLHFGGVAAGTSYKLMVNLMGAVQIAAAAEGLALAERAGLDMDTVQHALAQGQAASPQVVRNSRRMVDENHSDPVTFPGRLRHKDTRYALRLADELGLDVPLGAAALEGLEALLAAGLGDLNESSIIEVARGRIRPPDGHA